MLVAMGSIYVARATRYISESGMALVQKTDSEP
jgi:hypothetical protein